MAQGGPTQDSFVQVPSDGSGKRVRNLAIQLLLPDGTIGLTYMQVVSIADENGNPLQLVEESDWRQELLDEMRAIRIGMQQWLDAGMVTDDENSLLEQAQDYKSTLPMTEN